MYILPCWCVCVCMCVYVRLHVCMCCVCACVCVRVRVRVWTQYEKCVDMCWREGNLDVYYYWVYDRAYAEDGAKSVCARAPMALRLME